MNLLSCLSGVWCLSEDAMLRLESIRFDPAAVAEFRVAENPGTPRTTRRKNVAVLPLHGVMEPRMSLIGYVMGGTSTMAFGAAIDAAADDPSVASILMEVDSPGGSSFMVAEAGAKIRAARAKKPVIAIANPEASSGAYWLASQADRLYVTESGGGGSVGAYRIHVDKTKAAEDAGLKVEILRADSSPAKIQANSFEPLTDEARVHAVSQLNQVMDQFHAAVSAGRNRPVGEIRDKFGKGRVMTARDGVEAGLFDRVATFDDVLSRMLDGRIRLNRGGQVCEDWDGCVHSDAAARRSEFLKEQVLTH